MKDDTLARLANKAWERLTPQERLAVRTEIRTTVSRYIVVAFVLGALLGVLLSALARSS